MVNEDNIKLFPLLFRFWWVGSSGNEELILLKLFLFPSAVIQRVPLACFYSEF